MADGASKLIQVVRNHGMLAIRLGRNIGQGGLLQCHVTTGATVDHAQFWQPDLLNASLKVPLQSIGLAPVADHTEIAMLVMPPLAEEILRGSNRHRHQKYQAYNAEGTHTIPE